jgi:hypothetical protein
MNGNLYSCMKTTVELPDDLVIEVKKAAAERRTTIRDLVERGLRRELASGAPHAAVNRQIHWITVDGGLPPGLDVGDREAMYRLIAEE